MKFEFLIPASPTPGFFSQLALFRLALDRLGGDYAAARVVAVFGDNVLAPVPREWRLAMDRIEIHWVEPALFVARSYLAQGNRRFDLISHDADLAVICDADTLMMAPFDTELLNIVGTRAVAGVIAHYHFPWERGTNEAVDDWQAISTEILGHRISLSHAYTLTGTGKIEAPFYVNFGFVAGTPAGLADVWEAMSAIEKRVEMVLGNYFASQVGLALAVAESGVASHALPMRYNFPNDPKAERFWPEEAKRVILMHYLRSDCFNRQDIFASPAAFDAFLALDLNETNKVFRDYVRTLTRGVYPFPTTVGRPKGASLWRRLMGRA